MKVYEIAFEDYQDAVIWIATDRKLEFKETDPDMYCKLIPEYNEDTPGIDIVIT